MAQRKKKALTKADIEKKVAAWARYQKQIKKLEADKEKEIEPLQAAFDKKTNPIIERHDALIDPVQEKADAIETEVIAWLDEQKKAVTIDSRFAFAKRLMTTKLGDRLIDAEKFVAKCIERKIKDFWSLVSVTIKNAETVMGKDDMTAICKRVPVKGAESVLEMKD